MKEKDKEELEEMDEDIIDEEILDADYEKIDDPKENDTYSEVEEKTDNNSENDNEEINELTNQLLRLQADFSNYKKRMDKEKEGFIDLGIKKLVLDILPVIDNLERALSSIEEHAKDDEIFKGLGLIDDQFLKVLEKHKITEIKAKGEKFDPNLHHAVAIVESEDVDSDIIVDVLQKGYQMEDYIIRPSMVRVSK